MIRHRNHLLIILFVSGLVFFTNLGGPRLWDRDEPRNAGCAAEMLQRADWVTPVFNDELRSHKPVLLYWLMMSAYTVFGVSEFSARFWSACLGTGTVLLTYFIGQRLFHPRVGLWAAVMLATSLMFVVASRAATPDAVLVFCSTAALALYVWGNFQRAGSDSPQAGEDQAARDWNPAGVSTVAGFPEQRLVVMGIYSLMAIGVLAKGPVAVVLPMAVIGMFMLIHRQAVEVAEGAWKEVGQRTLWQRWAGRVGRCLQVFSPRHFLRTLWAMRPLTVLMMVALIALPWYVWVGVRTEGAWLRGFLLEHNLHRAMEPMEGHGGSFLYYPLAACLGFFPWSIFAIPMLLCAARRTGRSQAGHAGYVLVLCWVGVYIGLFSVAQTKLPSYITPCYPGLAILAGAFLFHWTRHRSLAANGWVYLSMACLMMVGITIMVGVPLAAQRYLPGDGWIGLLGVILLVGGIVGWILIAMKRLALAGWAVTFTSVAFTASVFGFVSLVVDSHQQSDRLLKVIDRHHDAPVVGALGALEPSWVYYLGSPIQVLSADAGSESDRLPADGSPRPWAPREAVPVLDFLQQGPDRVVITTEGAFAAVRERLPDDCVVLGEVRYFLKKERLLAIGRKPVREVEIAEQGDALGRKR